MSVRPGEDAAAAADVKRRDKPLDEARKLYVALRGTQQVSAGLSVSVKTTPQTKTKIGCLGVMVTVMPTKHPHQKPNNTFIFALGRRSTRNCPEHAGKLVLFCLVPPSMVRWNLL